MGNVLGISAYYHDAAAALVCDGKILAAAQEERFSRVKHDPRFPSRAINYCLGEAFIEPSQLDAVVFYESPVLSLDRLVHNALEVAPRGRAQFTAACRAMLGAKAEFRRDVESALGCVPPLRFTHHHIAHAASCFYPAPYPEAAILVLDGVGEWATCSLGVGKGQHIELRQELRYPHSLGLLYSAFTYFCGFKVNSGEYKLMGLSPYGEARYADLIRRELIDIREDGSFRLNTSAFGFLDSSLMVNARFAELFDGPARTPEQPITQRERDLAASVQKVVEEVVLGLAAFAKRSTGQRHLCLAGGVALNCVANGRLLREAGLDGVFVQPAAGDAGGALGAALLYSHQVLGAPRDVATDRDALSGSLLGPAYSSFEVEAVLDRHDLPSHQLTDAHARAAVVARALADGKIVGLFSGRMEFGPRALGARSILADPRRVDMQARLNADIKRREAFRPFAPAVLAEHAAEYFELAASSDYMQFVAPVRHERRRGTAATKATDDLSSILHTERSDIPAVTHVDYSARVQTVGERSSPELRRVLTAFHAQTGCAVLVNTSFNVRGEPMVCTPQDAYHCFMSTDIDLLVLEDRLLWKHEQPVYTAPARSHEPD